MLDFNWIDYAMLVVLGFSMLTGFARGLVREIISFVTFILAFFIATWFASPLSTLINNSSATQQTIESSHPTYIVIGLSFAILFVVVIAIGTIVGVIVNLIFQGGLLDLANRLSGAVFGFFRGCVMNVVIIFLVQLTSFHTAEAWQHSQFVSALQPVVVWLGQKVSPDLANLEKTWIKNMPVTQPKEINKGMNNQ